MKSHARAVVIGGGVANTIGVETRSPDAYRSVEVASA